MHLPPPILLLLLPLLFVRTSCLPALLPRQPFCANAPHTPAGTYVPLPRLHLPTFLSSPDIPPLTPLIRNRTHPPRKSTNTILWCAPSSRTYVILEMVSLLPTEAVGALLDEAINSVLGHVDVWGDGNVPGGAFNWEGMFE